MNIRLVGTAVLAAAMGAGLAGCATHSDVKVVERDTPYKDIDVQQPDFIIVTPVAVTPDQARRLQTLRPLSTSDHVPTADELRIGNAFASALESHLVHSITAAGIRAYPEASAPAGGYKTGIVLGYCLQGTSGSPVGFQL